MLTFCYFCSAYISSGVNAYSFSPVGCFDCGFSKLENNPEACFAAYFFSTPVKPEGEIPLFLCVLDSLEIYGRDKSKE